MHKRPKVLFLSYFFPPFHTVASIRSANIAKYLAKSGWDVTVVTPHPSLIKLRDDKGIATQEIDALGVKRIYTGHLLRFLPVDCLTNSYGALAKPLASIGRRIVLRIGLDLFIGWIPEALKACSRLTPDDVDVILATGGPWSVFYLADRLRQRLQRPFVLDYRDFWTTGGHLYRSPNQRNRRIETRIVAESAAVSAISPFMASTLDDEFHIASKLHIVPNGYDPADLVDVKPLEYGHFAIVYNGIFYPPQRDVRPLMSALEQVDKISPPKDWRFHYYGGDVSLVSEAAKTHGLQDRVVLHGLVPRRESLSAIRGADVAVVITSVYEKSNQADKGIITGKIFEPIGLGTPILLIAPQNADVREVIETVGGGRVFTGTNVEGMSRFIVEVMCGHLPIRKQAEGYSWPNLIQGIHNMLLGVVSRGSPRK